MMASFCGYCGTELDSSAGFCAACGKPVTDRSDASQATHSGAEGSSEESSPHRRRRRRIGLVVLLAALGLAGGVAAVLMVTGERQADAPEALPSSTTTSIPGSTSMSSGLPEAEVERLGSALSSGDPDRIASVIEVPEGVDVTEVAADMLPAGTVVTVHRDSFVDFGGGLGAVEATLSGSVDATVILFLRFVDGVWLVSGTSEPVVEEQ